MIFDGDDSLPEEGSWHISRRSLQRTAIAMATTPSLRRGEVIRGWFARRAIRRRGGWMDDVDMASHDWGWRTIIGVPPGSRRTRTMSASFLRHRARGGCQVKAAQKALPSITSEPTNGSMASAAKACARKTEDYERHRHEARGHPAPWQSHGPDSGVRTVWPSATK